MLGISLSIPQVAVLGAGSGAVPESVLMRNRLAYLINPPISEADMVSTTPVTKTIIATTKNKYATSARATTSLDSTITRHIISIGPASMTELNLEVHNWWWVAGGVAGETINTLTLNIEAELVDLTTGLRARFKFGGNNAGTVPITPGAAYLVSDALLPAAFGLTLLPAYSRWLLTIRRTASGAAALGLPWHSTNQSLTRELEFEYQYSSATSNAAAIAASYLDATPALVQFSHLGATVQGVVSGVGRPNSGATGLSCAGGYVITGRANAKTRAIVFVGDSKSDGTNDTQTPQPTDEGNGWAGRCLRDPSTGLVIASSLKSTVGGDKAQNRVAVDTLSSRAYGQANIGVIAFGANDLKGGRTFAQLRDDTRTIAQRMKAAGVRKVLVASCDPQTVAAGSDWSNAANQSFTGLAMFDPTGTHIRQDYNAQMAADAAAKANNIDGYIDFTTVTDDGTTGKWASAGGTQAMTTDGIHELPAMEIMKANIARAAILAVAPDIA